MKHFAFICVLFCSACTITYATDVNAPEQGVLTFHKNHIPFKDAQGKTVRKVNIKDENGDDLEELYVGESSVAYVPSEIGNLTHLLELGLSHNKIKELPSSIGKLKELRELYIGSNHLQALPFEIFDLTKLETLGVGGNPLKVLPSEIGKLTKLETLEAYANELSKLPGEISNLVNLKKLNLGENQFKNFPFTVCKLNKLQEVYLYSSQLKEISSCVVAISGLKKLDLSKNQISALPSQVFSMAALQSLNLSENQITNVDFFEQKGKMDIHLHHNPLERVGPHYGRLVYLRSGKGKIHAHFNASVLMHPNKIWHALHTLATLPAQKEELNIAFIDIPNEGGVMYDAHLARISIAPMNDGETHGHITVHEMSEELKNAISQALEVENPIEEEALERKLNQIVASKISPLSKAEAAVRSKL